MYLKLGIDKYKRESISKVIPIAYIVYVLLCFIDSSLAKGNFYQFLIIRATFGLPFFFMFIYVKKRPYGAINGLALFSLMMIQVGVAFASRGIGGLTSDYYFGLLVVSFLQFIFFPSVLSQTIMFDLISSLVFFTINMYQMDYDTLLFSKQLTNLLSFLVLKFLAINRFNQLFANNVRLIHEERKFEGQVRIQKLMGELCHLLNNPMFISLNFTKKILKTRDIEEAHSCAQKSLEGLDRMKNVTERMLKINSGEEDSELHQN